MTLAKIRWGVLSTAAIGLKKVIPGMQQCQHATIDAIASRDIASAQKAAAALNIPTAHASYEALLADPNIDAIYNPLPNHLHVEWTVKAAEAGKHVLCEKPLGMSAAEARTLLATRDRTGVKIGEAFMVRTHPQWLRLRELLDEQRIGELRAMAGFFSYFNIDPANIRNRADIGGGALMDIGCYMIQAARFAFADEPSRVVAAIDRDPTLHTDRLTSALLEFPRGHHATFTCSTQLAPYQRLQFLGTKGRIEVEVPVNVPPDRATRILIDSGSDLFGAGIEIETFSPCDQYTLQGDAFSKAILDDTPVPVSIEDGIANMAVIDAIVRSASTGMWQHPDVF
jgi:predicted dehydrogenase